MSHSYPSDISREQFARILPTLESVRRRTKPRTVDLYDVFCGVLYLLKSGCQWRMLPADFPDWRTCYKYCRHAAFKVRPWSKGTLDMARDHNREIGVCPHCLAWQIEFLWDYAETSYNRWLCRTCKRLFPSPRIVMFIVTADMTNYVPASQILWLERATLPETLRTGRIRRKRSSKNQTRIFFKKWPPELAITCLVVALILVVERH